MPFACLGSESLNPRPWDIRSITRLGVTALLLTACAGGGGLLLPGDGEAAHISVVGGDNQSGRVGEPLKDPLVVEVTDSRGRPVNGASVAFAFTSAGPDANIVPSTASTNAKGEATAQLVLGTTIGPQTGQASVVTQGAKPPTISFTVTAVPKDANEIAAVSGDGQTGAAGSKLHDPLVVQVSDAFGNPISGVHVDWTVQGGGSVSDASSTTDESGRASVERALGPAAGPQTTLATSQGLAGSPVTFNHTATAGNASSLSIVSGNNQTATAGTRLPADLVVRLVDGQGNGVPGTAVAWVVGIGGGSVTPQNGTTDAQGRASAQWTLGPNPGDNRVDAVVSGIGIANFKATGTAGAPAALAILTQPSGSAQNGVPFGRQPVVQVRDGQGNNVAISGVLITAQLSGSGGELIGTTQRATDANGRVSFTDLAISGATGHRTLVFTASGYSGATSSPIDVSAIATTTTITSDLPDPSVAGTTFTVEFRVTSAGPTPTGTVTVTVSDGTANCSSTLQNGTGSCQLTLARLGNRTLKATYSGGPGFSGSSGAASHQVTPANQPPHADYNWHCEGFTCAFTDNSRDSDGNVVSWSWSFGDGGSSTDRNPSHTFAAAGTYQVALTVTDNGGATNSSTAGVSVSPPANKAPHAEFLVACPNPDLTCSFTDQSTDQDGSISAWHWDFGDGGTSDQPSPSHTYATAGDYHVTLMVTDNGGATDNKTHDANPTAPPPPAATTTTITSDSPDPSAVRAPITVGFTVTSGSGVPSGNVTVGDGTDSCTGSLAGDGTGNCLLSLTTAGSRTLTATYPGNSSFSASSGTEPHRVDQPPSAVNDNYATTKDVALTVPAIQGVLSNDTDPDGDPLAVVPTNYSPTTLGGTVTLQTDGSFTYTPPAGITGSDTFTYSVSDGFLTSMATVTITIS